MDIVKTISEDLNLTEKQVSTVISLIEEGNTIPFIARYRKEMTGSLNDDILRKFDERYHYLLNFIARQETIIKTIDEKGALTDELKEKIESAKTLTALEDIYRPYKEKRKTRATVAISNGLKPLADLILDQKTNKDNIDLEAEKYITDKITTKEAAISGAKDIIAEQISDNFYARSYIRSNNFNKGIIHTKVKKDQNNPVFEMYFDYSERIKTIPAHRTLAINRGENQGVLSISFETPDDENILYLEKSFIKNNKLDLVYIHEAIEDSYKRLIKPSIDNENWSIILENAENASINVFKSNLKELLLEPPLKNHIVLGFDPAFRTGCKLAVVNKLGESIYTGVIYPTAPQNKTIESKKILLDLIKKYNVDLISLGNGTASRESEAFLIDLLKDLPNVHYLITNEAGASVYSASKLGAEEFPNYDVSLRSAVSLARRIQDPLAELVKIEPRSIGVGQYQHDMNQKHLNEALGGVVENVVNEVGVDVNLASIPLLKYVSGISSTLAENIVSYRYKNGKIKSRNDLLKVSKLGPKAFEQCAGFLRIIDENPLDNTAVHPESYSIVYKILESLNLSLSDVNTPNFISKLDSLNVDEISLKYGIGKPTLIDIIEELKRPGRDIRDDRPKAHLDTKITKIEDLKVGMILEGTIRNIMDFGAFVDIGVHVDGLVHISQLSKNYVKHPLDIVHIGEIVKVKVIGCDVNKKRISLSMKEINQ